MRLIFTAIAFVAICVTTCDAAEEALPFGLDKLHWRMSYDEASRAFAPLRNPAQRGPDKKAMYDLKIDIKGYAWQACQFQGSFLFSKAGLSTITLMDPSGNRACADAALTALKARYGDGDTKEWHKYYDFKRDDPVTQPRFIWWGEGGGVFLALYQVGGPAVPTLGSSKP
jgi:hypothetical protein